MKTKTPSLPKLKVPEAVLFDEKDESFANPDILWHMEEWIDAEDCLYAKTGIKIPKNYNVWCKWCKICEKQCCVDIYDEKQKQWLSMGDMVVFCYQNDIPMAPFIGLGRIEEVKAFVASRPASVFNDSEKMKGLILKSMTYYKKFYVPIV